MSEDFEMAVNWYAIQSKPNKEDALFSQLESQGYQVFYPCIRVHPVNPRSKKIKPYFPGYLFVSVDLDKIGVSALQFMPFARGMVSFDQEPATVPDALIQAVRKRVNQVNAAGGEVFDGLQRGDSILIQEGPFAGYEAIFDVRLPGSERVRVLIKLLSQRQVPLELEVAQIQRQKSQDQKAERRGPVKPRTFNLR